MPYVRVRRSKTASNYGLGMPAGYRRSLPAADNRVVRLEKAGQDVVPRLITDNVDGADPLANVNQFTFNATKDAMLAFNPLYHLVNNVQSFSTQKALYKEYRIKQVKVHVMLEAIGQIPLEQWTNGAPLTLAYSWSRSASYNAGAPIAYDVNVVQPNCTQKVWGLGIERPEFWTSITATSQGGEGNWLNCAYAPGTSPNTGMFFMPELHLNVELAANAASDMSNVPGVNVNPEVARNRIFCSCCGGDLDVDEVVREKQERVVKTVKPVQTKSDLFEKIE